MSYHKDSFHMTKKNPQDYTYIVQLYKMTKAEARQKAKELGEFPDEDQMRIYQDSNGRYYHD